MTRALAFGLGLLTVGLTSGVSANPFGEGPNEPIVDDVPAYDLRVVAPELPVPRNGSILIIATADDFGTPPELPIVQVAQTVGSTTTTFSGTLRQVVGSYWTWTPIEPLEVGQYLVSLVHPAIGTMSATVTIVDDVVLAPPAMLFSQPIASVSTYATEYASCQRWDGAQLVADVSFVSRVADQVNVSANLTFSVEPSVFHQYLYRAFREVSEPTPFVSSDAPLIAGPYREQAESYCFEVEAMDIATSTVHAYPDLTFCVAHGELESLVEHEPALLDDNVYRSSCMVPPAGYEALWCQANADCIDIWRVPENVGPNYCESYFDVCPDAMRPDAGASGAGGSGGTESDAGFVASSTPDAADDDRDDDRDDGGSSSGCSCSTVHASSSSPLSALLLAMLVAFVKLRFGRRSNTGPLR